MLCSLSTKLGQEEMSAIQTLEKELGNPLLAFSCHPVNPASLSEDQVAKIQTLENRLGISLVAVNA